MSWRVGVDPASVSSVGIVYAFSEANHAVFQNAGLWKLGRDWGIETWGYAPQEYLGLYYSLSKRFLLAPSPYRDTKDIYELEIKDLSRWNPSTWISSAGLNYLRDQVLSLVPPGLLHRLPHHLLADYKTKYFLYDSGLNSVARHHFESSHGTDSTDIFLGPGVYRDLSNLGFLKRSIGLFFQESFGWLREQIIAEALSPFGPHYLAEVPPPYLQEIKPITNWISSKFPVIFLRTRNISNKVSFQNAKTEFLTPLVAELLAEGFVVINSGTPPTRLHIRDENYLEFSHRLPCDLELSIAASAHLVMNTAWAGLFTAVSTLDVPLITFDHEWSMLNLPRAVSLLKAREEIGMNDVSLGVDLYCKSPRQLVRAVKKAFH